MTCNDKDAQAVQERLKIAELDKVAHVHDNGQACDRDHDAGIDSIVNIVLEGRAWDKAHPS